MSSYCRFMNSYTNTHTHTHWERIKGVRKEREKKKSVLKKLIPNLEEFQQSHLAISANVYCCSSESQGVPLASSGQRTEPLQNVLHHRRWTVQGKQAHHPHKQWCSDRGSTCFIESKRQMKYSAYDFTVIHFFIELNNISHFLREET